MQKLQIESNEHFFAYLNKLGRHYNTTIQRPVGLLYNNEMYTTLFRSITCEIVFEINHQLQINSFISFKKYGNKHYCSIRQLPKLLFRIKNLLSNKTSSYYINVKRYRIDEQGNKVKFHANTMIYNFNTNIVEYFEPLSVSYGKSVEKIQNLLFDVFTDTTYENYTFKSIYEVLPYFYGPQAIESSSLNTYYEDENEGYCRLWCALINIMTCFTTLPNNTVKNVVESLRLMDVCQKSRGFDRRLMSERTIEELRYLIQGFYIFISSDYNYKNNIFNYLKNIQETENNNFNSISGIFICDESQKPNDFLVYPEKTFQKINIIMKFESYDTSTCPIGEQNINTNISTCEKKIIEFTCDVQLPQNTKPELSIYDHLKILTFFGLIKENSREYNSLLSHPQYTMENYDVIHSLFQNYGIIDYNEQNNKTRDYCIYILKALFFNLDPQRKNIHYDFNFTESETSVFNFVHEITKAIMYFEKFLNELNKRNFFPCKYIIYNEIQILPRM